MTMNSMRMKADGFSIDVNCEASTRQIDTRLGYFDLKNDPNQVETLRMQVTNLKETPVELSVHFYSGSTATSGTIVYDKVESSSENSMNLEKYVKLSRSTIKLKPLETQTIEADLTYPEDFKGLLLGGFRFAEVKNEKSKEGIHQSFEMVKGLVIHGSEEYTQAELVVEEAVETALQGESVITLNIKNPIGYAVKNGDLSLTVLDEESGKTIFEHKHSHIEIAPFSTLPFQFSVEKTLKRAHTYRLVGELQVGDYHLPIEKNFETSQQKEKQEIPIEQKESSISFPFILYVVLLFIILLIVMAIIWWRKK